MQSLSQWGMYSVYIEYDDRKKEQLAAGARQADNRRYQRAFGAPPFIIIMPVLSAGPAFYPP